MVNITLGMGRDKVLAVIDIGAGGASVAITHCPYEGPSTILASGRSALTLEPRSREHATGTIGSQIQEAGMQALKIYGEEGHTIPVRTAHIIVHAPWARTVCVSEFSETNEDARIGDDRIGALAQKSLASLTGIERSKMIEAAVIDIELNGYSTKQPEGKYGHTLNVTSMLSDCDEAVKSAALTAVQGLFPVATVAWCSFVRALSSLVRGASERKRLLIDMGADSTHIVCMRGSSIDQRIVTEGVRTILARISASAAPEETMSNLRMLARDACSNDACEAVEKKRALAEPELARIFGEAIGQLAASRRVANDLVLITHPDLEPWLSQFFSRIDFSQFTATTLPFTVRNSSSMLESYISYEDSSTEPGVLVGAALVNMESHE